MSSKAKWPLNARVSHTSIISHVIAASCMASMCHQNRAMESVMQVLARAKRRVAAGIRSGAMHAGSRQTDFCTYLSAILLGGLLLNAALGWWWVDPIAGLVMVPIIAKEGVNGLRGKACRDGCGCH
jgi:hypothetical protein